MRRYLDTLRGRAFVLILGLLVVSNAAALWLYGGRHDDAMDALHDVMVAEQAAVVFQLIDRLPQEQRQAVAGALSGTLLQVLIGDTPGRSTVRLTETRSDRIGEIINALLGRTQHDRIRVALTTDPDVHTSMKRPTRSPEDALTKVALPQAALANLRLQGRVEASAALTDGTKLTVASRLLSVPHFSWAQLFPSLIALTISALLIAFWLLNRLTAPLRLLQDAAQRLASDINAPALKETGPSEVRSATTAFNTMQSRIKQLIADLTSTAAAIAHDLGTPVTRMRLRVFEVENEEVRNRLLSDLDQMQRMIAGALDFTRLDFETERTENVDLLSVIESVAGDLTDLGKDISVHSKTPISIATKPILLRRALMNLAENAINYGNSAEIFVTSQEGTIKIEIFDEGDGMSKADWAEATQPFRRMRGSSEKSDGSGLGLTIAKRIIENLGGTLERTQDKRSRFGVLVCFSARI